MKKMMIMPILIIGFLISLMGTSGAANNTIRFVTIGDTHINNDTSNDAYKNLSLAVDYINHNMTDVDFVVEVGDIVDNASTANFLTARSILNTLNMSRPHYIVEGDHDIGGNGTLFRKIIGPTEQLIDSNGYQLILVGVNKTDPTSCTYGPPCLVWEFNWSSADKNKPTIIFNHGPVQPFPFMPGSGINGDTNGNGTNGNVTVTLSPTSSITGSTANMNFTVTDTMNSTSWFNITFPGGFEVIGTTVNLIINGESNPINWTNSTGTMSVNVSSNDPVNVFANNSIQYINISNITVPSNSNIYIIDVTTNNGITVPLNYTVRAPPGTCLDWGGKFTYACGMINETGQFTNLLSFYNGHVHIASNQTINNTLYVTEQHLGGTDRPISNSPPDIGNVFGYTVISDGIANYSLVDYSHTPGIPPNIINTFPASPIDVNQSPSTVTFNVTTDNLADIMWQLDGVSVQQNSSVTDSSYTNTVYVGKHDVVVIPMAYGATSYTWLWNVTGNFVITDNVSSIDVGVPTNVTFTVTRVCGIEQEDNCSNSSIMPVSGAKINLNGSGATYTGSNITDENGTVTLTINAASKGTIRATATKYLYKSNYTNIIAKIVAPTDNGGGSGGGNGGGSIGNSNGGSSGGGSGGTAEPYGNIFKYETQEDYIAMTPVAFKYSTTELGVYEVDITGTQNDDVTLRIEVLKGTSKLVRFPAPNSVYKNINMWVNSKRIQSATIKYKIENSWLDNNKIFVDDIKMVRWDNNSNKWNELPTDMINKDGNYTYFESQTDGFSSFAISGLKRNLIGNPNMSGYTNPVLSNIGDLPREILGKQNVPLKYEIMIMAVIVILVVYLIRRYNS